MQVNNSICHLFQHRYLHQHTPHDTVLLSAQAACAQVLQLAGTTEGLGLSPGGDPVGDAAQAERGGDTTILLGPSDGGVATELLQ